MNCPDSSLTSGNSQQGQKKDKKGHFNIAIVNFCLMCSIITGSMSLMINGFYTNQLVYVIDGEKGNLKISKGQTEIVKSEDRQDHGQQTETKDKKLE